MSGARTSGATSRLPGRGGYAFAACVGVLVPVALGALMGPLSRMDRKKRRA
ncbi:hypothetical protein [Streptomyces sp. H51]|uniref:hypothetical protein n=1 Tax=Streptomyces sp. H51 TaxID=3111770 RepID=UPI002D77BC93|nr:hypothetical protein [Streptomyces sp. H51]